MSEEQEPKTLGPNSTIRELMDAVRVEEGTNVVPVTLKANAEFAEMMVIITGKPEDANVIMANIMTLIGDMYDKAEQIRAEKQITGTDGKPITDEPTIILP